MVACLLATQGKTYLALFEHLVENFSIVPMGLLRHNVTAPDALAYVLTNPGHDTVCGPRDRVFVLGVPDLAAPSRAATPVHHPPGRQPGFPRAAPGETPGESSPSPSPVPPTLGAVLEHPMD